MKLCFKALRSPVPVPLPPLPSAAASSFPPVISKGNNVTPCNTAQEFFEGRKGRKGRRGSAPYPGGEAPAPPKGNAGEIIPPAPPCFALRLRRAAGAVPGTGLGLRKGGRAEGSGAKAGVSTGAVRAANSVQACAAAPACRRRPMFRSAATSVLMEGFPDF